MPDKIRVLSALVEDHPNTLTKVSGAIRRTVEFSGEHDEVGAFVDELTLHGIVDVVRSGPVVMRRSQ